MEAFAGKQHYFNTFGGNPVSATVGNAVLDVIERDGILSHVKQTGHILISGLHALAERHEAMGHVRGKGFFVAVELVRNIAKKTPWPEAHRVVNGMRHQGVLVAVNGIHDNIIKIRPPLVFSQVDAARLVAAMDAESQRLPPALSA